MNLSKNSLKILIVVGVLILLIVVGGLLTRWSKDPTSSQGDSPKNTSGPSVSLKTEATEIGTLSDAEIQMSTSAPMVAGTGGMQKELDRLRTEKTEFIEDYLRSLASDGTGGIARIDEKKLMSLPARDIVQLEMAFDFVNSKSPELMTAIAKVLVNRETYGTIFREDSFEGALKKAYLAKTPVDYAKLKELKIESPSNLGFITGEIFFSSQAAMLNSELLDALNYRISLLPRNSRSDQTYAFIYLVQTFIADVISEEYLTPARALREITVSGAPNFFMLKEPADVALTEEAEKIFLNYRGTTNLKEVKAVVSFQKDLEALEKIYQKMNASETFTRKSFRGLPALGYGLASMYAIAGNPEKGLEIIEQVGKLTFEGIDKVAFVQGNFIPHKFRKAMIYEALGDKLYSTNPVKAKEAYENSIENMHAWLYIRPHYPLPRAFVNRLEKKIALVK